MRCKINSCFIFLAGLMFLPGCRTTVNINNPTAEFTAAFQYASSDSSVEELNINNVNGTVEVIGVDSLKSIQLSGQKMVTAQTETEAEDHIGDISIEMDSSGNIFSVITHQPNSSGNRNYEVDYKIYVPARWNVSIENINGNVTTTDINNDVGIQVTNGLVATNNVVGNLVAVLQNGGITTDITTLPPGDTCKLVTTNGQIALTIPKSISAAITASVVNGTVSTSNLSITETSASQTYLAGTIGKGGSLISLSAVNGTIQLNGK